MQQKHHYSEPYKVKSLWYVNKMLTEVNQPVKTIPFHSEKLAWEFLNEVKIYIDGILYYQGK